MKRYTLLGPCILSGLCSLAQASLIFYGSLKASRKFHKSLVHNLMALPMLFYDTNPQGRIMNRVSKDIDVLDTQIGEQLRIWVACLFRVLSIPVAIGYCTPWFSGHRVANGDSFHCHSGVLYKQWFKYTNTSVSYA